MGHARLSVHTPRSDGKASSACSGRARASGARKAWYSLGVRTSARSRSGGASHFFTRTSKSLHRRASAVGVILSALLVTLGARADVTPAPNPSCSVQRSQRPGVACRECAAWHGKPDACREQFGAQGYTRRCRTPGASVWHEVWCRGEAPAPPPARTDHEGCGACSVGEPEQGTAGGLALLALGALGFSFRRRDEH
jgi:MYXO-CTERM domain-containing protein